MMQKHVPPSYQWWIPSTLTALLQNVFTHYWTLLCTTVTLEGTVCLRAQCVMETWSPWASLSLQSHFTLQSPERCSLCTLRTTPEPLVSSRDFHLCGVMVCVCFILAKITRNWAPQLQTQRFSDCSRISSPSILFQVQFLRQNYLQSSHAILWVGFTWVFY